MSIDSATGNIQNKYADIIQSIDSASNRTGEVLGGGGKQAYGVDFAGMDEANIPVFKNDVDALELEVKDIIQGFNDQVSMEGALKGDVATATHEFLTAVKALLGAFVEALEVEKKEVEQANQNWLQVSQSISGNIGSDSDSIRGAATQIQSDLG